MPGVKSRTKVSPLTVALIVIVIGGVVLAFGLKWIRQSSVPVLVITGNIPSYHVLGRNDITITSKRVSNASRYARYPVDGRVVLRRLEKGAPLLRTDLGPSLGKLAKAPVVVTGVQVSRASVLGGTLKASDSIRLLLPSGSRKPVSIDAIVMSVSRDEKTSPPYSLVVAIRKDDAAKHAPNLASPRLIVVRDATG